MTDEFRTVLKYDNSCIIVDVGIKDEVDLELRVSNNTPNKVNDYPIESVANVIIDFLEPVWKGFGYRPYPTYYDNWTDCLIHLGYHSVNIALKKIKEYTECLPDEVKLLLELEN